MTLTGQEYDKRHPEIWLAFVRYTLEALEYLKSIEMPRKIWRVGSKSIFERIRDNEKLQYQGRSYKINNNYTAYYARKFMIEYKEFVGIFRLRKSTMDKLDPEASKPIILKSGQIGLFEFRKDPHERI